MDSRDKIELHDSNLLAVEPAEGFVLIRLNAYIHRAPERVGEPGTGWRQEVNVVLQNGVILEDVAERPSWLDDGSIKGTALQRNLITLPYKEAGPVRFELISLAGERLVITAEGLRIERLGEAEYVEHTPAEFYLEEQTGG